MSQDGQVVAMIEDYTNYRLKAVSITKEAQIVTLDVIKDFGDLVI